MEKARGLFSPPQKKNLYKHTPPDGIYQTFLFLLKIKEKKIMVTISLITLILMITNQKSVETIS